MLMPVLPSTIDKQSFLVNDCATSVVDSQQKRATTAATKNAEAIEVTDVVLARRV